MPETTYSAVPSVQFLPKNHLNTDAFVEKNPNSDGRGTIIAIWDTGIDPTAAGLQITPSGETKILDMIDASGSGDVKMKAKCVITDNDRVVQTLTGRTVTIPSHWKPRKGLIYLGVKLASELFPKALLTRLRSDYRHNVWRPTIKKLMAKVAADLDETDEKLNDFQEIQPNVKKLPTFDETSNLSSEYCPDQSSTCDQLPGSPIDESQVKSKVDDKMSDNKATSPDHKAKLKISAQILYDSLTTFDRQYTPLTIVFDCFVFHNGNKWLACVDTSPYNPKLSLDDMPLLSDYSIDHQCASFGERTQLFYTVKIFNEGKILQIVTNNSSHGTHVAAMAAAYFPPNQNTNSCGQICRNGIAPGAHLVSIKISDSRLSSMETNISLLRAIRWTVKLNCDVVNYSFGEQEVWPNVGRICQHLNQLVYKHGIVMVSSGGNNGPGLGTVGSPGGTVDGVIGVAPIVFPEMMRDLYSQPSPHCENDICNLNETTVDGAKASTMPTTNTTTTIPAAGVASTTISNNPTAVQASGLPVAYTWGSRGPSLDGGLGLFVSAPGAANTSVAGWQLAPSALLNGSSMSSPLVAGAVALIISGLRQKYIPNTNSSETLPKPIRIPPILIQLALMNTANYLNHLSFLDQGFGLVDVDSAFTYLDQILNASQTKLEDISTTKSVDQASVATIVGKNQNATMVDNSTGNTEVPETSPELPIQIPDLNDLFGWRIQCIVHGPGCLPNSRGIWLRRGWLLNPRIQAGDSNLPLLRYSLDFKVEFHEDLNMGLRREFEIHLVSSIRSALKNQDKQTTKPNSWIQIAHLITMTSTGRTVSLVLDPNKFPVRKQYQESSTPSSQIPIDDVDYASLGMSTSADLTTSNSKWCWPSSFARSNTKPQPASKPHVVIIDFRDSSRPELGVLTSVPITIHMPYGVNMYPPGGYPRFIFADNFDVQHKVRRWFVEVPVGATAGVLRLARIDDGDSNCDFRVMVTLPRNGLTTEGQEFRWPLTKLPKHGQRDLGLNKNPNNTMTGRRSAAEDFDSAIQFTFPISWDCDCIEITIGQHWGLESSAVVIGELYYRGLESCTEKIVMSSSDRYCRIGLRSNFISESLSPDIWLSHWVLPLRPIDSSFSYLGHTENELLPDDVSCYALRLVYQFNCPFWSSTVFALPWVHELLYSSDYLLQVYHIYDARGRLVGAGEFDRNYKDRPKFVFYLDKGLYKVVVQICHEDGPVGKLFGPKFSRLSKPANKRSPAIQNTDKTSPLPDNQTTVQPWSALQSLQNAPAVVRFQLNSGSDPCTGFKSSNVAKSADLNPVKFEFAGLPCSLNLNGAKPCSAMMTKPVGVACHEQNYDTEQSDQIETRQDHEVVHSSTLVKRLSCLPHSLYANETTSIFIGLTDERQPSFAVPGSYFSGTIGFYSSDLLHKVLLETHLNDLDKLKITYPFRLVMDSPVDLEKLRIPASKPDQGDHDNKLVVGLFGLSDEDFTWLTPVRHYLLGHLIPNQCAIPLTKSNSKINNHAASDIASETLSLKSKSDSFVSIKPAKVSSPTILSRYRKKYNSHNELLSKSLAGESLPSESFIGAIHKRPRSVPRSFRFERSVNSETASGLFPSPFDEVKSATSVDSNTKSFADLLGVVHQKLANLDKISPDPSYTNMDLKSFKLNRSEIWMTIDSLMLSPVVGQSSVDERLLTELGIKKSDSSTNSDISLLDCLLQCPLFRLTDSVDNNLSVPNNNQSPVRQPQQQPQQQQEEEQKPNQRQQKHQQQANDQSLSESARASKSIESDGLAGPTAAKLGSKPKPSNNMSLMRLQFIDILCRYGRLLCEKILFELGDALRSPFQSSGIVITSSTSTLRPAASGSTPSPPETTTTGHKSHTSLPSDQSWSLLYTVQSTPIKENFQQTYHHLNQIYSTLVQSIPSTLTSQQSVGSDLQSGRQALPQWLLASLKQPTVGDIKKTSTTMSLSSGDRFILTRKKSLKITDLNWGSGSVGGRLIMFFLMYALANQNYAQALELLIRILYQIDKPPDKFLQGNLACTIGASGLNQLRPIQACLEGSMKSSKAAVPWISWVLSSMGWSEIAAHLDKHAPILFPERDYSLFGD